jgi:hypothetical protein
MTRNPGPVSVTISARRWAVSPVDSCVHLLPDGEHLPGALMARCGHLVPTEVHQYDQPPPRPPCEGCRLTFLADFALRAAAGMSID